MKKIKQGRGSPDKTLGAPLDKRQGLLALFFLWSVGDGVQDCCSCNSVGPGWSDAGCNKHQSGCTVVQGQGFFTSRIGEKRCHLCSTCSRKAWGAGEGESVSVPTGPAPVCVSCAVAATYWDGGLGIPALLLSHQGSAPGCAWPLPSLCLPPSGQQPQLLMEALAGRQQHPGASSSAQLSSPGPPLQTGPSALLMASRHHSSLCEVTAHRFSANLAWVEGSVVWQRLPEWAQTKGVWERGSSGLGNGGEEKSWLVAGSCPECPQSISQCPKRGENWRRISLHKPFSKDSGMKSSSG